MVGRDQAKIIAKVLGVPGVKSLEKPTRFLIAGEVAASLTEARIDELAKAREIERPLKKKGMSKSDKTARNHRFAVKVVEAVMAE